MIEKILGQEIVSYYNECSDFKDSIQHLAIMFNLSHAWSKITDYKANDN